MKQLDFDQPDSGYSSIFSRIPSWIVRWGTTIITGLVVTFLLFSWFIKYPEAVNARIVLTTKYPPARIIAKSTGRIQILIENDQPVKEGEVIGYIENPSSYSDVLILDEELMRYDRLSKLNYDSVISCKFSPDLKLGDLQNAHNNFLQNFRKFRLYRQFDIRARQLSLLEQRAKNYETISGQFEREILIVNEKLRIAANQFKRDSILLKEHTISELDLEATRTNYLTVKFEYENLVNSKLENEIRKQMLHESINSIRLENSEQHLELLGNLEDSYRELKTGISVWRQTYLFRSPISGQVTFTKFWSSHHHIQLGEEFVTIIPHSQEVIGKIDAPLFGSGDIENGQKVIIKLDNYPYTEYGPLHGTVSQISLVPRDQRYIVTVALPSNLNTTYNKRIPFMQEMQGSAKIITKEMRLIERMYNKFRQLKEDAISE